METRTWERMTGERKSVKKRESTRTVTLHLLAPHDNSIEDVDADIIAEGAGVRIADVALDRSRMADNNVCAAATVGSTATSMQTAGIRSGHVSNDMLSALSTGTSVACAAIPQCSG